MSNLKKITILALHLGTGGAENVISNLSNILCEDNDVSIISTYKLTEKPAFYINPKVKITYLMENLKPNRKELNDEKKKKNIIQIIKQILYSIKVLRLRKKLMIKAIKNCDSDIIISTRVLHSFWLGKYGKPTAIKIAQEHNHHNNDEKIIKRTIKSLKNIDFFMPVSHELYDFYKDKIQAKCVYIPNSLDFYPTNVSKLDNKNFISVGRLSKEKGFSDLINIFSKIVQVDNEAFLRIVGEGEEHESLQNQINNLGLNNNIELCGLKNKEELDKLYIDSSVYLMASYTESFGIVLIEAESYGIPIVVFDSAQGAKEIVQDGKNGFIISNRDEDLFVERAVQLMSDSKLRCKLGTEGRKKSENYRKEVVREKWNNFLGCMK